MSTSIDLRADAPSGLSPLKRAYLALDQAQARCRELERADQARSEPIAVVGVACRLPGGADGPEAYWRLLEGGVDAVCDTPADRFDVDAHYDPDPTAPGKMCTRRGGFLREPIDRFDAPFFGISPREAESMDPQHRLLLEVGWEALENGAQAGERVAGTGSDTGVFIGITSHDYADLHLAGADWLQVGAHLITGNTHNAAAGRLSYCFGFQGPCVAVDTACSSSLVAVHLACRSLLDGECRRTLAGGVNLILSPTATIALSQGRVLAPDGCCRAFDAAASGMVRAEGCAVVVLKRLSHAIEDGDDIRALIRGSAINQDGPSSGLTVPNGPAQEALIRRALAVAGVEPGSIDYLEAHGTGTPLGDPIELRALAGVFGAGRDAARPLVIGSAKTNLGHLEACAGMAGLIKVVLSLQHRQIPPHLHFSAPTPHLPWNELPFVVPTETRPWPEAASPRRAGVSSFGFSGVNAHVVLEEAPRAAPRANEADAAADRPLHLLVLSGRCDAALRESARRHAAHFERHPGLSAGDACGSAAAGRAHASHRLGVIGASLGDLGDRLAAFADDGGDSAAWLHRVTPSVAAKVAFLFTGQGSQYPGMGRGLFDAEPAFRRTLERCDLILRPYLPCPLLELLYGTPSEARGASLDDTACAQPALFALEYALSEMWRSWGVEPTAVLGHSLGEYSAACVAGVFGLEDGLRLVAERGALMQRLPRDGAMLTVDAPLAEVERALRPHAAAASIAACNAPGNAVVSGHVDAIAAIAGHFAALGVRTERLRISHAFHSPLVDPVLDEFERSVASVALAAPRMALVSCVDGAVAGPELALPAHWRRHLRATVRFADAVAVARARGCSVFLEIGPKPTLIGLAQQVLDSDASEVAWLPSLRPARADLQQMLESLAGAHLHGVRVDWAGVDRGRQRRRVALPTTPFQRERCWLELPIGRSASAAASRAAGAPGDHPLLGASLDLAASRDLCFESCVGRESPLFLQDHCVFEEAVLPASAYLEIAAAAACTVFASDAVVLENISFERAMRLPARQARTVQTVLRPDAADPERFAFEIHSRGMDVAGAGWLRHSAGTLRRSAPGDAPGGPQDPARFLDDPGTEVDVQALYRGCRDRGIGLGPRFQALGRVWRRGDTALGEIALPRPVLHGAGAYRLHPVLLDAALQVIGGVYAGRDDSDVYLPVALDRLVVHRRGGSAGWSRVRVEPIGGTDERSLRVDVEWVAADGQRVAAIDGLHLKRIERGQWQVAAATAGFADWLYEVDWQPDTTERAPAADRRAPQRWLILAPPRSALADALQREVAAAGDLASVVPPAAAEALPADFTGLLAGPDAPARIVDLWPTDPAAADDPHEATRLGCEAALQLVQAVARAGTAWPAEVWFVTRDAQPVGERPALAGLLQAPVTGLAKVAALEHPELRIVCVDLDADDGSDAQDAARALHAEICRAAGGETQVALRRGQRHVARLARHAPRAPRRPVVIRPDASYLVTGGQRGLGLETARWLVGRGARSVVLLGRSDAAAEIATQLAELRRGGAVVLPMQADVSDAAQLARVFADIDARLPPLAGIVHAAGVLDDGIVAQLTIERLRCVLAPKLLGAWHLHCLTRERRLDFFVMYSSLASLFGSPGQGNYVAANAFLDALAHHRRAHGLPALAINWGAWSEIGAAVRHRVEQRTKAQGMGSIAPAQGMSILEHLLAGTSPQVGVAPIDWPTFAGRAGTGQAPAFFARFAAGRPRATPLGARPVGADAPAAALDLGLELAAAAPAQRCERLAAHVRAQVAGVLRLAVEEIDTGRPLNRIGLDSLMAVELRNRLRAQLGLDVPLVRFMEETSIRGLAADLAAQLAQPVQPAPPRPPAPLVPDEASLLARLDELSDDQIDALLDAALADPVPPTP
ncbi:type I polyketide synthase [Variovorax sp. J22R115]|uniref:type I polyketide synthase n=1 Tax=Variovorax sp. J22R115 TaxID=3053509 RepID=UPI002578AA1E|nr:type I polyketide synthase [Variovorax sp. J22R115]MDM0053599.1 type I polyketide synthase [Variovorax sp. J22R115]